MPVNGGMLRIARQRKGFQQGEAANRLGVAQATLSRAENGIIEPSDDLLDRAVFVYGLPRSFFSNRTPYTARLSRFTQCGVRRRVCLRKRWIASSLT